MDTLKQAVTMGAWEVDLIATPDGMETMSKRSGSRVDGFDCEANATWCLTGGFAKSEAAAGSKSTISSGRAQSY